MVNGFPDDCGLTGSLTAHGLDVLGQRERRQPRNIEGGGAAIDLGCPAHLVISGNKFSGNMVHAGFGFGYGGGLQVLNESGGQLVTAQQDHNVFRGNAIDSTGAANSIYFGGGESLWGVTLTSTDDTFIDNTLPRA